MNKLRLSSFLLSGLLAVILLAGCSLKEDRSDCPCVLLLDFSGVDRDRSDSLSLGISSSGGFLLRDIIPSTAYGELYEVEAPKEELWINAYGTDAPWDDVSEIISQDGSALTIPYGRECPEINTFSLHTVLMDETVTVPVVLHKNYCRMSITMASEREMPYRISIVGNVCGYDRDGQPTEGGFLYEPAGSEGIFYATIPRQTDSSLKLDISDDEEVLRDFAIGEYIIESGYDWSAEDLNDVEIQIDYAKTNITVRVNDWTKTIEIEVVI